MCQFLIYFNIHMPHAIYQTPAIILQSRNYQESNKLLVMYTRDFGLVYVNAQSLRGAQSKMKYHALSYNYVDVDLVRGKSMWRLTGIQERVSSLNFVATPWYGLVEKITRMLIRLVPGEEAHDELWQELELLFSMINQKEFHQSIEYILVARILNFLGYYSGEEKIVTDDMPYTQENYQWLEENKKSIAKKINQGLIDSQL